MLGSSLRIVGGGFEGFRGSLFLGEHCCTEYYLLFLGFLLLRSSSIEFIVGYSLGQSLGMCGKHSWS